MHVSDIEMRDDELLKAGRSSSIGSGSGSGSGSGKQGLGGVAQEQLQLPGGSSQGPENGIGSVGSATSWQFLATDLQNHPWIRSFLAVLVGVVAAT